MGIAEENSGKLVTLVRQKARTLAEESGLNLPLTDGPPSVGCPVSASIGGASGLLIVTEPTVSGRHDMERVIQLAAHFRVPAMVCGVSKFDLNPNETGIIEAFAAQKGLTMVGKVPFDPVFTKAMVQGQTVLEYNKDSEGAHAMETVWEKVQNVF